MRTEVGKFKAGLWTLLLMSGLTASFAVQGFGQGFTRLSLPIPIGIDGQQVHGPIYLKVDMKSFDMGVDQFAAGKLDKAEGMFASVMQSLQQSNEAKFAAVWEPPNKMKRASGDTAQLVDNTPKAWLDLYRANFEFDSARVVAEVALGSESVFVWEARTKNGPVRRAFLVGDSQKGQVKLTAVTSAMPVAELVLSSFAAAQKNPDAYKPLPNINPRYQYPIPMDSKGSAGAHPVFFDFDGTPMDFSLTDEKAKAPDAMLEFLRSASRAYATGKYEEFAGYFTPKSAESVKAWIASVERERQRSAQAQGTKPDEKADEKGQKLRLMAGYVKFVLNADPVFLVFEAPVKGNDWSAGSLSHQYVVREASAGYKIANFSFGGYLDDFLQNSSLFDKRILKPVVPKAAPKAAPAKVPAAKSGGTAPVKH